MTSLRSLSFFFRGAGAGLLALSAVHAFAAEALLVKNALLITMKPGAETPYVGYMTIGADGRISAVAAGAPPVNLTAEQTIDAAGKFVAPGFVSSHSHLGNSGLRGLGHTETLYPWGQVTARLHAHSRAEDMYWFSLAGAHEFVRNGITTVFDFTRAAPSATSGSPELFADNQIRGKLDGGIRFINAIPLPASGTRDDMVAHFEKAIARAQAAYGTNPLFLKLAVSGGVQRAASKDYAFHEAHLMKTFGLMNQSHFLESPERIEEQQSRFAWYVEAGALGPDFIFGHFIHTTPEMIATTAKAGASMSWQPLSNGRLASGIADIPAYRAAGLKVGIGLDSNACTDTCDPFGNMHVGLALIRAKYTDAKALSVRDALYLHTLGAAEVLRIADQVGSLEPGKFADFLIVDPRRPYTGPIHDPIAHYVLTCGLRNLESVYIGGKLAASGATLVAQDEAKVHAEVDARIARLVALAEIEDKRSPALTGRE